MSLAAHPELACGALDQLLRHMITGCAQSAQRAALILERIESAEDADSELSQHCQRVRERLEDGHV